MLTKTVTAPSGVLKVLNLIADESGTNEKMNILRKHSKVPHLKEVMYLAKSRRVKFYIRQIPEYEPTGRIALGEAIKMLDKLSSRSVTGTKAFNELYDILCMCTESDAKVIEKIIDKDLRIGMGSTNINKVFPNLIEKTPYMGAIPYSKEAVENLLAEGSCFSQVKMDGRYANAIVQSGFVDLESRDGEPTFLPKCKIIKEMEKLPDCVLTGELTIPKVLRYLSNGIIASIISIQKKMDYGIDVQKELAQFKKEYGDFQTLADSIVFTVWDCISLEEYHKKSSPVAYNKRLASLRNMLIESEIHSRLSSVRLISSKEVFSYKEAMADFYEKLAEGEEGTILKAIDGAWKNGKPAWQVKVKLEMEVDLVVNNFLYGTGKNENVISSIEVSSADGKVATAVSGMTEKVMEYVTKHQKSLKGTIMRTRCSGLSKNSAGGYSLLHPRAGSDNPKLLFRDDKSSADTYAQIVKIENAIKGI